MVVGDLSRAGSPSEGNVWFAAGPLSLRGREASRFFAERTQFSNREENGVCRTKVRIQSFRCGYGAGDLQLPAR